jgi:hypothetical protein
MTSQKKPYSPPRLIVHGNLADLTATLPKSVGGASDAP